MSEKGEYRYERLSSDNIHHLITLFKWVFNKKVFKEELIAKYGTHHSGKNYLGYIAFDGDRPVAYGGFVSYYIRYNDVAEIGAQSVDSMSLPELKGKGVFTEIARLNEELLKKEGISFAYGFGNQNSTPVFVHKFGYYSNESMAVFMIPVKTVSTIKLLHKAGLKNQLTKKVERVLKPYIVNEIFENPFVEENAGYTVYDEDFFKYKSFNRHYMIRIEGIMVWLRAGTRLSIGNIEHCEAEKLLLVVDKLQSLAQQMGCSELLMQFSPGSLYARILKTKYRSIEGSPICIKSFNSKLPLDKILFAYGDIDTF